jgi:hypothetical protein
LDWTSIVYYGDMAKLAKFGYSRDHHPGERQLTLGAAMLEFCTLAHWKNGEEVEEKLFYDLLAPLAQIGLK